MFDSRKVQFIINDEHGDAENMGDFIPLFSKQEEDEINKEKLPEELPILPIRNTVLFPGVVFPITVGRDKSIKLIKEANKGSKIIGVCAQRDASVEDPGAEDLYNVGTLAVIMKVLRMPDGNTTLIIQGRRKFQLGEITQTEPYLRAKITPLDDVKNKEDKEFKALMDTLKETALQIIDLSPNIPSEAASAIRNIDSNRFLVNFAASNLNIDIKDKQEILNSDSLRQRAELVLEHLTRELQMVELKDQIQNKVRTDIDKQQKEYFLQQQIRAIQEELGQESPDKEIQSLREKGNAKKWSKDVHEHFNRELDRILRINPASPDYSVGLNYVQLLLDLPWGEFSTDSFDVAHAAKILDEDHFGLEKVKKRILEYLAVIKLKGDMKSPIICLYGPPGVGKTSLGRSIARAVGRKYVRMSLGGLHDESEIRGHRKTYIGAMPGRIIQNLKKAGTSNPVFVLDEVDKLGRDFRGDPSSALLEVLDPEQNTHFYDNYIEVDYDLSKVMFIATANNLDSIQPALLDRMEVIEIAGYTVEEKIQIAKKYLVPKQREAHGLKVADMKLGDKVIEAIVDQYTLESGVRGLEKRIATIARNLARRKVGGEAYKASLSIPDVQQILGAEKIEREQYEDNDHAGVVTGLAWSQSGGSVLFVESAITPGKGNLVLTGQLGDVMKESATLARTFIKSQTKSLGINPALFDAVDIHIHFPAGAIPKDGPSAGVTILTALASLFTQKKVRAKLAMTGEITLRGKVLPVGGIKEKILAAKRAGITDVLLCEGNRKDIEDINPEYVRDMRFHYVKHMEDVLKIALTDERVSHPVDLEAFIRKDADSKSL